MAEGRVASCAVRVRRAAVGSDLAAGAPLDWLGFGVDDFAVEPVMPVRVYLAATQAVHFQVRSVRDAAERGYTPEEFAQRWPKEYQGHLLGVEPERAFATLVLHRTLGGLVVKPEGI